MFELIFFYCNIVVTNTTCTSFAVSVLKQVNMVLHKCGIFQFNHHIGVTASQGHI